MDNLRQLIKSNLIAFSIFIAAVTVLLMIILAKSIIDNKSVLGVEYAHSSGVGPVVSTERIFFEKGSNKSLKYSLSLNGNPGELVKVGVSANSSSISFNGNDANKFAEIEFTESDWNLPKEIVLELDDNVSKGKYLVTNTLNKEVIVEIHVTTPGIIFEPTTTTVEYQEDKSVTYAIALSQNPYSDFKIVAESSGLYFDESNKTNKYEIQFNQSNWDVPQFVKIFFEGNTLPGYKNIKHTTQYDETFFYAVNIEHTKPIFESESDTIDSNALEYSYWVYLDSDPAAQFDVIIRTPANSGLFLNPERTMTSSILSFDSSNWNQKREVRLYTHELLSGQEYRIEHESLGRKFFKSIYVDGLFPVITKDTFNINNANLDEISYSVRLNKQPTSDTVVSIDLKNFQYFTLSDGSRPENINLHFTDFNWSTFQNIVFILDESIPYGSYPIVHQVQNYQGSQRTTQINVSGNKLVFDEGRIVSTNIDLGYADFKLKLDSNPGELLDLELSGIESGIYFDSNLEVQTAKFNFNSENWNKDNNIRVYFDKERVEPFNYYDVEAELNGNIELIRIYPHL